jgi:hypothetical protein
MTEQEWLECRNFHAMLECFRGKASERKLWLLCVALCRHIWDLLTDPGWPRSRHPSRRLCFQPSNHR